LRVRRLAAAAAATLAACAVVVAGTSSAPAAGRFPDNFMGVDVTDSTLLNSPTFFTQEAAVMHANGVQTIRIPVYWAQMQPTADGPIRFGNLDRLVMTAAQNQLRVLPTVLSSPEWAALHPGNTTSSPPRNPDVYAAFVATLVKRYGRNGAFWKANPRLPRLPIETWQIWNEPSLSLFWSQKPFAASYVALLKASRTAIKRVDPSAQIMLAGLPDRSWVSLQQIYTAGGGGLFDIAAVHPYTHSPAGVLEIVAINRRTMARNGDGNKPISLTEMGWSTKTSGTFLGRGITWNTNLAGQAHNLTSAYTALAKSRAKMHIQSVYWFTWYTPENSGSDDWENFSGLRRGSTDAPKSKPALAAYSKVAHQLER
jgi:hypothetical protein